MSSEELVFRHGAGRVAVTGRAYEGVTNAINNQYLLGTIYRVGITGLAMAEVGRMYFVRAKRQPGYAILSTGVHYCRDGRWRET